MTPNIHYHGEENNLLIANDYDMQQNLLDIAMAKEAADCLNAQYPGHMWAVNCRGEAGIMTVHNLMLSGVYGDTIKLHLYPTSSALKARVIRGAGEILERYKVSRGRINHDQIEALPMDFAGRVIGDLST